MPFITDLKTFDVRSPIVGCNTRITQSDLEYYSARLNRTILVPSGFITDFSSIPQFARWYMHPTSKHIQIPAVLHNFIYQFATDDFTKAEADFILCESMRIIPFPCRKSQRRVIYYAVKFGSKGNW